MKASVVDLRYKMNDILKALDRNEKVTIHYHGKKKGVIIPEGGGKEKEEKIREHPFFGMSKECAKTVKQEMDDLRGPRY